MSVRKYLEMAVENKTVSWIMDVSNMGLQLSNLIIYCVRTHDMCAFEKKPLWKVYSRTLPDGTTEFWDKECQGELETLYYNFLLAIHIYFLFEFLLRTLVHKYYLKALMTHDSLTELFTTVPFLILRLTINRTGAHRQL